nr:late competence development ComFB family protein [uncultured Agathobaculum sp.]
MPAKRSNKTARVLNLITNSGEAEQGEQQAAAPVPEEPQTDTPTTKGNDKPAKETAKPAKEKPKGTASKNAKAKDAAPAEPPQPAAQPAAEPVSSPALVQTPPPAAPAPVVPIVQNVREKEQALSDDIKSGLLEALSEAEAAEAPSAPAPQEDTTMPAADETASEPPAAASQPEVEPELAASEPVAVPATPDIAEAPAEEPISVTAPIAVEPVEPSPEAAEVPTASPAAPPVAEPTTHAPQAPEPAPAQPEPSAQEPAKPAQPKDKLYTPTGATEVEYTNVLQSLVEDISPYYICNMLQCNCQRCIADMKALALTNLPSKYVVLEKDHKAAYMSVYAARYEKLLSVQMMRACVIVNEHPHH